jgi:phage terminase large subunit-like protein
MGVRLIGVVNKTTFLRRLWALPNDLKHNEARFTTISTDLLHLRVAQTPRSRDLAIFGSTDDRQPDCFTPAVHARTRGKYYIIIIMDD